jgi:hypothetical protein
MRRNVLFYLLAGFILFVAACGGSKSGTQPNTTGTEGGGIAASEENGGPSTTVAALPDGADTAPGDQGGASAPPASGNTPAPAGPGAGSSPSQPNWKALPSPVHAGEAVSLSMTTAGGVPYVAWEEAGIVSVARWDGTAWKTDRSMNHTNQTAMVPTLTAEGNALYLAWVEHHPPFKTFYLAKREEDGWTEIASQTGDTECGPGNVDLTVNRAVPTVAWDTFCNDDMYASTSVQQWAGAWVSQSGAGENGESRHFGDTPYFRKYEIRSNAEALYLAVASEDNASKMKGLHLFRRAEGGWVSQGGMLNDPDLFSPASFSLAMIGSKPSIAFHQGNLEVKQWSGEGWTPLGAPISATADDPHLIGVAETPYLIFTAPGQPIDGYETRAVQVSFWNGAAWAAKGSRLSAETDAAIRSLSLAASENQLYAAWIEGGSIRVMSMSH